MSLAVWRRKLRRDSNVERLQPIVNSKWKHAVLQRHFDKWRLFTAGTILKRLVLQQAVLEHNRMVKAKVHSSRELG